ncbi:Cytoskeleton associated protein 5, partial [Kappamyces sp. JEL0680]
VLRACDLVGAISPSLNQSFGDLSPSDTISPKICKHLTSLMVQVFSTKESASLVPYQSLETTIRNVLFRLVDPALQTFDSTKSLSRALNMLMVRIIDNCEPNATFRCLLLILREVSVQPSAFDNGNVQTKYCELVMKCLWKITKVIPNFLNAGLLHVDLLLLEINAFLNAAPPTFWKQKTSETGNPQADMPLRTVKTILHELVNVLNDRVIQFTNILPESQSHTVNYLRQMLLNVKKKSGTDPTRTAPQTEAVDFCSQLDAIFAQIADKEETKLGIQRLYDIQKKYPSILPLVNEKLSKTGSYFQGYIRRGLSSMEEKAVTVSSGTAAKLETAPRSSE